MSRFYATIIGSRGEGAARTGTAKSGIKGHIRGWNLGVRVDFYVDEYNNDVCNVILTGGSNDKYKFKHLGTFREEDLK